MPTIIRSLQQLSNEFKTGDYQSDVGAIITIIVHYII